MRQTEHCGLRLFEGGDPVRREDFNTVLGQIDAAIGGKADGPASSILPPGVIVLWSGAANAIPSGWALCNGQNGTPDLRNRFVVGAGSTYSVGAKGGEATHKLKVSEMPSHTHSMSAFKNETYGGWLNSGSSSGYSYETGNATAATGGGAAHNNLPPYYALCYIMRL